MVEDIQASFSLLSKSYGMLGLDLLLQMFSTLPLFVIRLSYKMFAPDVFLSMFPVPSEQLRWEGSKMSQLMVYGSTANPSIAFGKPIITLIFFQEGIILIFLRAQEPEYL